MHFALIINGQLILRYYYLYHHCHRRRRRRRHRRRHRRRRVVVASSSSSSSSSSPPPPSSSLFICNPCFSRRQVWMVVFAASTLLNIVLNMFVHQKIRSLKLRHHDTRGAPNPESLNIRMKQEAFVTVSLLLLASVFCRMPFPVVSIVALNLEGLSCDPEDLKTSDQMNAVVILLLYVTFFADPIIYLARIRDTRNSYKALFRKARARLACCRSNSFETQCDGVDMKLVSPRETSQSTRI